MCGNGWNWLRTSDEGGGVGEGVCRSCKLNARGVQENLWPKSSLERPVARHFVWSCISTWRASCNPLKIQARPADGFVGIALSRERFTPGVDAKQRRGRRLVERAKRLNLGRVRSVVSGKPYWGRRKEACSRPSLLGTSSEHGSQQVATSAIILEQVFLPNQNLRDSWIERLATNPF